MSIDAIKNTFFNSKDVMEKIPPAIRSALSKFGAFVRRADKSSLKYRDGSAAVGRPPNVHRSKRFSRSKKVKGQTVQQASSPLRELIFFAYDAGKQSVVIGPASFASRQDSPGTLPAIIERRHPHTLPAFKENLDDAATGFKNLIR